MINFLLKVIQAVIFSINTYKQDMISAGNKKRKIKNRDRWNYCHYMPMLPLLGGNHRLLLLHKAKRFIWIEETGKHINEFDIGYMINPNLHVNKYFKDQVEKCMNTTFGEITKPFITAAL